MKECKVHIYTKSEILDKIKDFYKAMILDNINEIVNGHADSWIPSDLYTESIESLCSDEIKNLAEPVIINMVEDLGKDSLVAIYYLDDFGKLITLARIDDGADKAIMNAFMAGTLC